MTTAVPDSHGRFGISIEVSLFDLLICPEAPADNQKTGSPKTSAKGPGWPRPMLGEKAVASGL